MAGAAGKRTSRGRVHAIVGLDPAGPLFSLDQPAERMHHTGKVPSINDVHFNGGERDLAK